jgi:hypothetical protein
VEFLSAAFVCGRRSLPRSGAWHPGRKARHCGGDGKDQADAKKDAKEKSASNSRASARVPHRYYNYYSGRHYGWHRRW